MNFKRFFLIALALSSVVIVGMILYTRDTVQDMVRLRENTEFYSSTPFLAYISKLYDYTAERITIQKPFIYLTETEQCLPRNLSSSSQIGDPETCNCDVIVLSFRAKCQDNSKAHITYLFDPNTLFASGRNVLFFAALDRRPGYHYYIFLNDDTILQYSPFAPEDMKKLSPFRAVETWLLDYEPVVGVVDYKHHGANYILKFRNQSCGIKETASQVLPTVFYDALFNAYHHKAIEHILPYPTQYERGCVFCSNRQAMIAIEVKFGGQALLFAPVRGKNPLHRRDDDRRLEMAAREREFVDYIRQEAPAKLRNHAIFQQMKFTTVTKYLSKRSRSYCANITRHQPIIPYKHLLGDS